MNKITLLAIEIGIENNKLKLSFYGLKAATVFKPSLKGTVCLPLSVLNLGLRLT